MITHFSENVLEFSSALAEVAADLERKPETRRYYTPLVLAIVDSHVELKRRRAEKFNAPKQHEPMLQRLD